MNDNKTKPLTLIPLIALVVGNMVGSGIFLLPADLAKFGTASLFSWVFTVIGAFLLAKVLSQNSRLVPKTGGPYAYAKEGFGKFIGFQTAYCHWLSMWVATAALAIALTNYLGMLFPVLDKLNLDCFIALLAIWGMAIVNMFGIRLVGKVQVFTVILKLVPILLIVLLGWFYFHPDYIWQDLQQSIQQGGVNFHSISSAASLTLWAFIGIESATIPYASLANPSRDIPLATFWGTLIAAVLYVASSTVIMGMLPKDMLVNSLSPFVTASEMIMGSWGKWVMLLGASVSCLGALNGWTCLYGQVAMAAADDGLFPRLFALRNKRGVPAIGIGMSAILGSIVLIIAMHANMAEQFKVIIAMASFASLIPYLYSSIANILIMQKQRQMLNLTLKKRFVYFGVAFLAAVYSFWALCGAGERLIFYGSILLFTSVILYAWSGGGEGE
ncbi:MAG: hypothetical protein A2X78_04135 [Gammaproteobacteria bacterium GWE2_37_16]|nr:MAG: hypothetical protein A2X78_04135 [Gammaproteobacteria bacterium GWE2_37_16]